MKQDISFHYTYTFFNIIATNMIFQNKNDLPNNKLSGYIQFSSVQSLSSIKLFVTAARQASLSIANSQSSPKLMSIESVMPSNSSSVVSFSSCPQSFGASGSFPMSQLFPSSGQSIGVSASTSVLPMNILN